MKRHRLACLATAFLTLALPAAAAGEFDHLVHAVESHYGIKQTHVPFMGVANVAAKLAHPAGTHGFRLAIFQDVGDCSNCFDIEELDSFIVKTGLHPLVRTHSHGEATYVLTGEIGKNTRMMVATFGSSEAVIVEVVVDLKTLLKTIGAPGRATDWADF